jgi:hypothetical protein
LWVKHQFNRELWIKPRLGITSVGRAQTQ